MKQKIEYIIDTTLYKVESEGILRPELYVPIAISYVGICIYEGLKLLCNTLIEIENSKRR